MADVTYERCGMFTTFYANTVEGEAVLRAMLHHENGASNKFLSTLAPSIISQIKRAGYSVRKGKKDNTPVDVLLSELLA